MIVKTTKEINGVKYDYTYSDAGMMIERDGAHYSEAIDPIGIGREYNETDEPIEVVTEGATETDYQNALREMGAEV
jgi:hypothetical protein